MVTRVQMINAILLAAGFGTRMGRISKTVPKPLISLGKKPLLEHTLENLESSGIKRIAINIHHRADSIEAYIRSRRSCAEILLSDERGHLLDTGGGILQALRLLEGDIAFVHNCDAFWLQGNSRECDDFARLLQAWNSKTMDALLLLQADDTAADFSMGENGALHFPDGNKGFHYVGVQIVSSTLFENVINDAFPIQPLWNDAIRRGRLHGLEANASTGRWLHAGTSTDLETAQSLLLESKK